MAAKRVLGVIKRRSAWEGSADQVMKVEFRDSRANRFDPTGTSAVDVDGATTAALEPSPGGTAFVFANGAHAELHLADEASLVDFVTRGVGSLPSRSCGGPLPDRRTEEGTAVVATANRGFATFDRPCLPARSSS